MAASLPLLLAFALTAAAQVPSSFTAVASPDGDWTAEVPAGWPRSESHRLNRSWRFISDLEPSGLRRSAITAKFFQRNHLLMPTPEAFIRQFSKTAPEYKMRVEKPRPVTVAGVAGKRFATNRLYPMVEGPFTVNRVRFVEDWVLLPAHGGYYVLNLSCGEGIHPKLKPAFERFLKTFKLTGKSPPPVSMEKSTPPPAEKTGPPSP